MPARPPVVPLLAGALLLGGPSPARASMDMGATEMGAEGHAGHHHHHGMASGQAPVLDRISAREGSGTSWHPAAADLPMFHVPLGDWLLMLHGRAQAGVNEQTGPRGGYGTAAENWGMAMAERPLGFGRLQLRAMVSAEPLTIPGSGEPQLMQTGETWQFAPLVDHQHPHDAVMELAARYALPLAPDVAAIFYAGPVGEPALGPEAFMHRPSAGENPWAPLGHHQQDSTHITDGVVTEGLVWGDWQVEASAFNGREPGENRWLYYPGPLDSCSARLSWNPTPRWSLQVSGGHLSSPETLSPGVDQVRTTASVAYAGPWADGTVAAALIWGHTHEIQAPADEDAVLLEGAADRGPDHGYTRLEWLDKGLLRPIDPGYPARFHVLHVSAMGLQHVGAVTVGGVRDLWSSAGLALGVGGDVTVDYVANDVAAPTYGSRFPVGVEAYVRVRPAFSF